MAYYFSKISWAAHNKRPSRTHKYCHAFSILSESTQNGNMKFLFTFVLLGLFTAATSAVDEKIVKPASSGSSLSTLSTHSSPPRDEIYIDDEGIEGSGGRGEIHDDLEKDPDYSGSGFGPDDEDSSTDHHQSIGKNSGKSQHTNDNDFITSRTSNSNSGTIIGSSGSGITGNSGIIDSSNTGIHSIGKDHHETHSHSQNQNLHHQQQLNNTIISHPSNTPHTTTTTTTTTSSVLNSSQTNQPIFPSSPTITHVDDDDDDDFDLDKTIGGASGDGHDDDDGYIDNGRRVDDDDDDSGDDDIDQDIITGVHHTHDLDASKPHHSDHDDDDIETEIDGETDIDGDDDIKHHIDPYHKHEDAEDHDADSKNRNKFAGGDGDRDSEANGNDVDGDDDDDGDGDDKSTGTNGYTDTTITNEGTHKRPGNNQDIIHELDLPDINNLPTDTKIEHTTGNEVLIMSDDDRTTSFFAQPGILAAVIGGAVVGLLCAILVVMFIVYRMRKKDEGSYALDEPKRSPAVNSYAKNANNREFYA